MLLNGWPLRFPIGTVKTTPGTLEAGTILLNGATVKGDMYFTADGAQIANLEAGDYFRISGSSTSTTDGSFSEVRRVVSEPTADNFKIRCKYQVDFAKSFKPKFTIKTHGEHLKSPFVYVKF